MQSVVLAGMSVECGAAQSLPSANGSEQNARCREDSNVTGTHKLCEQDPLHVQGTGLT